MKTKNVSWTRALIFAGALLMMLGCDSSNEPMGLGDVEFQVTDAPSDDASIQSVFVTVADIKVDGQSVNGFTRTTFDLKAYREGAVKVLATTKLASRNYSSITLVLDTDTDANGAAPGCYVLTNTGAKFKLRTNGTINVVVSKSWNIAANSKSTVVLDFDLRKAIRTDTDQNIRYQFVSNDNLNASVRLVARERTGTINGNYTEQVNTNSDMIVAYAYKKGTYNANVETSTQGEDAIRFRNAVTSAMVNSDLTHSFKLAFLEEGDYEIHFASYQQEAGTGQFTFQSMLQAATAVNGSLGDQVTIQAGATVSVVSTISGTF